MTKGKKPSPQQIAEALSVVNRHAKAAPDPRHLYDLKKNAIQKLLEEHKAEKVGLHYSNHPKFSQQHSTLLIQVGDYSFHIPPSKEDMKSVQHLGHIDGSYRNPKPQLSLKRAKLVLYDYLGWEKPLRKHQRTTSTIQPFGSTRRPRLQMRDKYGRFL
ncbi:YkyB family protein [Salirhabdus salicampi]|uniref:YkyB family protein n=1 Tax=Salirhabdus salicampi TaxID=476102 RepID=UPI0020C30EFA|nr:YkyB family protein [Salirhabdus salicampi]MCP8616027.1 YkyB family protein [Salirhabdus salicampi]